MYESYWNLQQKPFASGCDPRFYYPGEAHQAALLKLRYTIENRCGGAILAGPSGSGKSMLVAMLRCGLNARFSPVVHIVFPEMSAESLVAFLAEELDAARSGQRATRDRERSGGDARRGTGIIGGRSHRIGEEPDPPIPPTTHRLPSSRPPHNVRRIERFLAENAAGGNHAVVIVDEAHLIESGRTWEVLRLLSNFESDGRPGLTLLVAGQPGLLPILDRMPHLEERFSVKCLLRPLGEDETAAYVHHRLRVAGAVRDCFQGEAFSTLHRLTQGIPRRINRLCDLALLVGYAEGCSSISGEQLEAVSEELVAVTM
jgi:type II secretory pathway predicted ATPase ExeA